MRSTLIVTLATNLSNFLDNVQRLIAASRNKIELEQHSIRLNRFRLRSGAVNQTERPDERNIATVEGLSKLGTRRRQTHPTGMFACWATRTSISGKSRDGGPDDFEPISRNKPLTVAMLHSACFFRFLFQNPTGEMVQSDRMLL
jgi:hypothetical protein